jgi:5-hydroxyisourate hydrolase-like protein (transthyretin family)
MGARVALLVFSTVLVAGLASAAWAAGEQTTSVSMAASAASAGVPTTLTGRLTDGSQTGIAGATLLVEASTNGASWVPTATLETGADGSFTGSYAIRSNTVFRCSYAGEADRFSGASAIETATFTPTLTWGTRAPIEVSPTTSIAVRWSADVQHAGCYGVYTAVCAERNATRTVTARGVFDPATGRTNFVATIKLPSSGHWTCSASVASDAVHGGSSISETHLVGKLRMGLSANDYSVPCGASVRFTGTVKDYVTGKGVVGDYVQLQRSSSGGWKTVATAKTNAYGKAYFYLHPRLRYGYRLVHPRSTRYESRGSDSKVVATYYKITLSRKGDYPTKRVYLPANAVIGRTVRGLWDVVRIHNSTHTWSGRIEPDWAGPLGDDHPLMVPRAGYYHFRLTRTVAYVTITLWPPGR